MKFIGAGKLFPFLILKGNVALFQSWAEPPLTGITFIHQMEIKINFVSGEPPAEQLSEKTVEESVVIYKCRISIRENYRGHQARESILFLNGFEVTLQCDGRIFDNETYPNEALFVPCTERDKQLFWSHGLKYLAGGDVTILERIPEDKMPENLLSKPVDARKKRGGSKH